MNNPGKAHCFAPILSNTTVGLYGCAPASCWLIRPYAGIFSYEIFRETEDETYDGIVPIPCAVRRVHMCNVQLYICTMYVHIRLTPPIPLQAPCVAR
jgi:hypothetical protein